MQNPLFAGGPGWIEAALALVVIVNLSLLAVARQRQAIRLIALQGLLLGILPALTEGEGANWRLYGATVVFVLVKGMLMPWLLMRTYKTLPLQENKPPYLGNAASVALGLAALAFSIWLNERLGISANDMFFLFFPTAFATVITGLLMIISRRRAIAQVFGYLLLENGIYLLSVPMAQVDSLWLELTILLDVLVGVFVMGIALHHINKAFDSIDVDQFASLRD